MVLPSTIPALTIYRNAITRPPATPAIMVLPSTIPALTFYRNAIT